MISSIWVGIVLHIQNSSSIVKATLYDKEILTIEYLLQLCCVSFSTLNKNPNISIFLAYPLLGLKVVRVFAHLNVFHWWSSKLFLHNFSMKSIKGLRGSLVLFRPPIHAKNLDPLCCIIIHQRTHHTLYNSRAFRGQFGFASFELLKANFTRSPLQLSLFLGNIYNY